MRILIWPVLFVFLILLQGSATVFYTGWITFDLPFLALYCYAMLRGELSGALVGFVIGFLQDSMTIGLFGMHMLVLSSLGFFIGLTKEKVFKDNIYYHMIAIAVCSIVQCFAFFILELIRNGGRWSIFFSYLGDTLGYALGNALLVIPTILVMKKIYVWIKEDDISY